MHPDDLRWPVLWHREKLHWFDLSDIWSGSQFGGPSPTKVVGAKFGPSALHHIMTLGGADSSNTLGFQLPLFYGVRFSGCSLAYNLSAHHEIELLEIDPADSTPEWPYPDHPTYLPCFPLKITDTDDCSFEQFCSLSMQLDNQLNQNHATILVPSPPRRGAALWGN